MTICSSCIVRPRVVVGLRFLNVLTQAVSGNNLSCMIDQFDPKSKSTLNIFLDVIELISSLIIMGQSVFTYPEPFGTGIFINTS